MIKAAAAEPKPHDRVLQGLLELEPAQAGVRSVLGLPVRDETAVARLARRYRPPPWAQGCISAHDAMFLYDLVRAVRPDRVIEVGVAAGGSTALLLLALADAGIALEGQPVLHSFELHPFCYFDRTRPVGSAVAEMVPELAHGVKLHVRGTAAAAAAALRAHPVSLALIDADHRHPCPTADLLTLLPALRPGAWVALHDIALPEIAAAHERRTGEQVSWGERGAQLLFEHWPFEKVRGGGTADRIGARNIGAIRIPIDHAVSVDDLQALIDQPWEVVPDDSSLGALQRTAKGEPLGRGVEKDPVIALIAPHGVSGVSAAMARLARLGGPHRRWRLMAVGADAHATPRASIVGSETPEFSVLGFDPTASPVQQVRMVRDRLRKLDARVVSPNFLLQGFIAAALDRHRGRRCAALWHGSELAAEDLYERAAPLADAWRAVSPAIRERVFKYSACTRPPPVLPTGVEIPEGATSPPGARDPTQPLKMLYAAWLDERAKRVMDLAPLADALHAKGVDFRLTIAGRGPAATKLAAALASHIVAGRVSMVGAVDFVRMAGLHREHDVLLLVSAMEGTPVVVMEAMAQGRPAAVTRGCGGALKAIRDGENGVVVDVGDMPGLADRLAAIAGDRRLLGVMGARAFSAAREQFDIALLADGYDDLVDEALRAPAGPDPARPAEVAAHWNRVLAALELLGSAPSPELAGLAGEWLVDLGCTRAALHLTPDTGSLLEPLGRFAPGLISCVVATDQTRDARFAGWPVVGPLNVPAETLVLSTDPARAAATLPLGTPVLPLTLPGMPTLAARLMLNALADLERQGKRRIALYGAGKHTRKLARWIAQRPLVVAIIDDLAGASSGPPRSLWGLPVLLPSEVRSAGIDAVVISSDEHERTMLPRARSFAPGLSVVPLYATLEAAAGALSAS